MALVGNHMEVMPEIIDGKGAKAVEKRVLIGPAQGAPNYIMRHFRIKAGGYTPDHSHPWEHEVYVLKGYGFLRNDGNSIPIKSGDYVFVPAGEQHQFCAGDDGIEFICVIPKYGQ
ncbi:oxalate-binding protein [Athalassotoga saccharophila]|nr:oxalate-binding protein [Athalassotoga saccharophila]